MLGIPDLNIRPDSGHDNLSVLFHLRIFEERSRNHETTAVVHFYLLGACQKRPFKFPLLFIKIVQPQKPSKLPLKIRSRINFKTLVKAPSDYKLLRTLPPGRKQLSLKLGRKENPAFAVNFTLVCTLEECHLLRL